LSYFCNSPIIYLKQLYTLKHYFIKYKKYLFSGIVFVLLSNLFSVMSPQLTGHMINKVQLYINPDYAIKPKTYNFFVQQIINALEYFKSGYVGVIALFSIVILVLALLRGLFMYFMRQTLIVMSRHIEFDQKNDIYTHYQKLNQTFYKQQTTGDLMNRISEDVSKVRMFTGPGIMYLVNLSSLILLAMYFMFNQNATLAFIVLLPLPLLAVMMYHVNKTISKRSEKVQVQLSNLTSMAQEAYAGIRIVKAFNQEEVLFNKYEAASKSYKDIVLGLVRVESLYFPVIALMIGLSTLLAIFFGGKQVINNQGNMDVGVIIEFVMYVTLLTFPVSAIGWVASIMQKGATSQKRINEFLQIPEDVQNSLDPMPIGDIVFDNVHFTYANTGQTAIKNFSARLPYGSRILITGATGCGKSTLAQLLLKFYNVKAGSITINNVNINNINVQLLRESISYVPQDVFLFSETIADNIAFGLKDKPEKEDVYNAAKNAAIHNEIEAFAEGYETMVGERGVTLSGGQKQRISIARGLIKNGDYIILDDCLSALDVKTERTIINHLQHELKNKLSIIISHRVSSYTNIDLIIVMNEGTIQEMGTHETLMKRQGAYYNLFIEQSKLEQ
jgi:ATP-binding cassette, subfamily B, multidrug efflux pump